MGGGVRTTRDRFTNDLNDFALVPGSQRLWIYNGFVQDRIRLTPALSLTVGIKAEETSFTGVELLPNLRLAWQPDERTLLWAAVSRAVRTPSRIDRELEVQPLLLPAPDFVSEKLIAFEAGYRGQPTPHTTLSISVFYNLYDDIRTADLVTVNPSLQVRLANGLEGHSYGVEAWSTTQLASWWRLNLGASAVFKHFRAKPGHIDLSGRDSLGHDPDFQLFARTRMNLTDRLQLNAGLRYVGEIDSAPPIGAYVEADASLVLPADRSGRALRRRAQFAARQASREQRSRARPSRPAQPRRRHEAAVLKQALRLCLAMALCPRAGGGAGARADADRGSGEGGLPAQVRALCRLAAADAARGRARRSSSASSAAIRSAECSIPPRPPSRSTAMASPCAACPRPPARPAATSPSSRARRRRRPGGCCSPCASQPILTITDARAGPQRGMIHFTIVAGRVRFFIDDAEAATRGLSISSRLLALAAGVRQRR